LPFIEKAAEGSISSREDQLQETEDGKSIWRDAADASDTIPPEQQAVDSADTVHESVEWPPAPARPESEPEYTLPFVGMPSPAQFVFTRFLMLGSVFGILCGIVFSIFAANLQIWLYIPIIGCIGGLIAGAFSGIILGIFVNICHPVTSKDFSFCAKSIRCFAPPITLIVVIGMLYVLGDGLSQTVDLIGAPAIGLYLLAVVASMIGASSVAAKLEE